MMFKLNKINNSLYEIVHEKGKHIGNAVMLEDGYFHIQLFSEGGFWSDESLIQIGILVFELNKPYNDHLKNLEKEEDLDDLEKELKDIANQLRDEF